MIHHLTSTDFSWSKTEGSAFISDLQISLPTASKAHDRKIMITSKRTGRRVLFNFSHVRVDADMDVKWWHFTNSALGLELTIYND